MYLRVRQRLRCRAVERRVEKTRAAHVSRRNNNWSSAAKGWLEIGVAGEITARRMYDDGRVALQSGVRGTRLDIWATAGDGG